MNPLEASSPRPSPPQVCGGEGEDARGGSGAQGALSVRRVLSPALSSTSLWRRGRRRAGRFRGARRVISSESSLLGPLLHRCVEEREKTPKLSVHQPAVANRGHLDTATKNGSGTLPEPAGGTPTLRSAAVPAAGSRGFPAPRCFRLLLHLVAVSKWLRRR